MSRKTIFIYIFFIFIFSTFVYFFVLYRKNTLYSLQKLDSIIYTPSQWRTKYLSPCDTAINGEPDATDWVKINFHCPNGVKNSTFVTTVLKEKSWRNIIIEYARVIGFSSSEIFDSNKWNCYLGHKNLINNQTKINWDNLASSKGSIDCIGSEYSFNIINKYYETK